MINPPVVENEIVLMPNVVLTISAGVSSGDRAPSSNCSTSFGEPRRSTPRMNWVANSSTSASSAGTGTTPSFGDGPRDLLQLVGIEMLQETAGERPAHGEQERRDLLRSYQGPLARRVHHRDAQPRSFRRADERIGKPLYIIATLHFLDANLIDRFRRMIPVRQMNRSTGGSISRADLSRRSGTERRSVH